MTQFHVGTAGWSYLEWDKAFYPPKMKTAERLAYYASRFNAVELNNSFYRTPTPDQFQTWAAQVPSGFRFAMKASRYLSHVKKLKDAAESLPPFLDAINGRPKAGPVLFQLPPDFPMDLDRLGACLARLPKSGRYAFELRDGSWHNKAVYSLLQKYNAAFCLFDTLEEISPRVVTADFAYVRLRGRETPRLGAFLKEWKGWLSDHSDRAYVFFDNLKEKRLAFGNALQFREMTE